MAELRQQPDLPHVGCGAAPRPWLASAFCIPWGSSSRCAAARPTRPIGRLKRRRHGQRTEPARVRYLRCVDAPLDGGCRCFYAFFVLAPRIMSVHT